MEYSPVQRIRLILAILLVTQLMSCGSQMPNDPYPPTPEDEEIFYAPMTAQPNFLDPARSYSANESVFTAEIYEPPLQYRYAPGIYELIPQTTTGMPIVTYLDAAGSEIDGEQYPDQVDISVYTLTIQPGILYQPHPAFVLDEAGNYAYHRMDKKLLNNIEDLNDFPKTATRELKAEDYVYEIKRIAWPKLNSPIMGVMDDYIVGLDELNKQLMAQEVDALTLRDISFEGAQALDDYTYQIKIKGSYPQFKYWLAMPFFAPIPWEADVFYSQPILIERNIVMDWYPVGTGPYMMTENNPNRRMVMSKNPNSRLETSLDKIVFTLDKEAIPQWNKFLQGYYDLSGVTSDTFSQAIQINAGQSTLTPTLKEKNIQLTKETRLADYYWGFNMLDKTVGGYDEKQQKLRQALSIALNVEEYIDIFTRGQGIPAQSILPPGLFGYQPPPQGINPYVYEWKNGEVKRQSIEQAKKLLAEAGYPNGMDPKTGMPLVISYDAVTSGDASSQTVQAWMRKQFRQIGIDLDIRATDYNRFQEKLRTGNFQLFLLGWIADYPDPENFLFLLYGPNSKAGSAGVNSTNYNNPAYDRLFEQAKRLPDNEKRRELIHQMIAITQQDAPMIWGFYPEAISLSHQWLSGMISNEMVRNEYQYLSIDTPLRTASQRVWNEPVIAPVVWLIGLLALIILPFGFVYIRRMYYHKPKRFDV